ncbi:conserved hypothetical protein [Gammaproteobacteria bacterium]
MAQQRTIPQDYPRINDTNSKFYGCLDDSTLVPHRFKISIEKLKELVQSAISNANVKSSRAILSVPEDANSEEVERIYRMEGKELFKYFKKYYGDPASTAHQIYKKHYSDVCKDLFRDRTMQKERMNSGWRYQYLAKDCANESQRFKSVSDIGAAEADFNAIIEFKDHQKRALSLYVSIKNRVNTMGGQDWPKAIHALEEVAKNDKNRTGAYCCVFGIAMDRGMRTIKIDQKKKQPHSSNTEIWKSDFFWPFFSNYSYEEIMTHVLEILLSLNIPESEISVEVPQALIESFGQECKKAHLINDLGHFHDPYKLVTFFCQ